MIYNSGILASDFVEAISSEADITIEIPESSWYRWLSQAEQLLYTEFIKPLKKVEITIPDNGEIDLSSIAEDDEDDVNFDDIVKIYVDGVELRRGGAVSSVSLFRMPMYWLDGRSVYSNRYGDAYLIYIVRPMIKTPSSDGEVAIPVEWLDMVAAKMRGEAYKIANDDGIAAKWLADYNQQLASFKVWCDNRNKRYGE